MIETTAETTSAPAEVVERFLRGFAAGDAETAISLLAEDIVYENVSLPTIRGRRAVEQGAAKFFQRGLGFEVAIHRIAAEGTTVITERTDALTWGRFRSQFWVCGVFEVRDGQITLWRDYFDWANVTVATLRGVAAMLVPSLQSRMPVSI
ncbi:MAG TPA: limonene-1,2-epoxide hydrolase family protein [Mycobacteriales bacterium]|jgi:limonene-1,2-epoxide hydrolase|nr:limonene-1,2-epoxide hydrolase family protein [Mycobacteriales bacterium]